MRNCVLLQAERYLSNPLFERIMAHTKSTIISHGSSNERVVQHPWKFTRRDVNIEGVIWKDGMFSDNDEDLPDAKLCVPHPVRRSPRASHNLLPSANVT